MERMPKRPRNSHERRGRAVIGVVVGVTGALALTLAALQHRDDAQAFPPATPAEAGAQPADSPEGQAMSDYLRSADRGRRLGAELNAFVFAFSDEAQKTSAPSVVRDGKGGVAKTTYTFPTGVKATVIVDSDVDPSSPAYLQGLKLARTDTNGSEVDLAITRTDDNTGFNTSMKGLVTADPVDSRVFTSPEAIFVRGKSIVSNLPHATGGLDQTLAGAQAADALLAQQIQRTFERVTTG